MRISDFSAIWSKGKQILLRSLLIGVATVALFMGNGFAFTQTAAAYPFWAQETAPETPREATGRIVCANCHLAQKGG